MLQFGFVLATLCCILSIGFSFPSPGVSSISSNALPDTSSPQKFNVKDVLEFDLELNAIAIGNHSQKVDNMDLAVDKRLHVVAMSWLELWRNLTTVDQVTAVLAKTLLHILETSDKPAEWTSLFLKNLDQSLKKNRALGETYKNIRNRIENEMVLPSDHFEELVNYGNVDTAVLSKSNKIAAGIFHWFLLRHLEWPNVNKDDPATVKATFQLSKKPEYVDQVQRIYDEALLQWMEKSKSDDRHWLGSGLAPFFDSLRKNFKHNSRLATEFDNLRRKYLLSENSK